MYQCIFGKTGAGNTYGISAGYLVIGPRGLHFYGPDSLSVERVVGFLQVKLVLLLSLMMVRSRLYLIHVYIMRKRGSDMQRQYIPGDYKLVRRQWFYQCRECWFRKVSGRLAQYSHDREVILVGDSFQIPEDDGEIAAGRYLLIHELQVAMKRQWLNKSELKRLMGANSTYVSIAASKQLGVELTDMEVEGLCLFL